MLDPEPTDRFVSVCQRKIIICQPVTEVGGVEVQADSAGLGVVHPTAKVCGLNGIAVYKAPVRIEIDGVQSQLVLSGDE